MTYNELAKDKGVVTNAVRLAIARARKKNPELAAYPGANWEVMPEHLALFASAKVANKSVTIPARTNSTPEQISEHKSEQKKRKVANKYANTNMWNDIIILLLFAMPTVASIHNMYAICFEVFGNIVDAVAVTGVLSITAAVFLWMGIKGLMASVTVSLLFAFEVAANTARIYYGLMGSGKNPTSFMGMVCDITNTGTHGTAVFIGLFCGLMLLAVQVTIIKSRK